MSLVKQFCYLPWPQTYPINAFSRWTVSLVAFYQCHQPFSDFRFNRSFFLRPPPALRWRPCSTTCSPFELSRSFFPWQMAFVTPLLFLMKKQGLYKNSSQLSSPFHQVGQHAGMSVLKIREIFCSLRDLILLF